VPKNHKSIDGIQFPQHHQHYYLPSGLLITVLLAIVDLQLQGGIVRRCHKQDYSGIIA